MEFLNTDVLFGNNALTNATGFINQIDTAVVSNCVMNQMTVVNNCDPDISTERPTSWDDSFIMNADAARGTLNAGNVDDLLENINAVKIKRRELDKYSSISEGWIDVAMVSINNLTDLKFMVYDITARSGIAYEYTLVPVFEQYQGGVVVTIESGIGENSVRIPVNSDFQGVFICDTEGYQSLFANVSYDDMTTEQLTGVHQTLGGKYPIVVANSAINYATGGVSGTILNKNYGTVTSDGAVGLNRSDIVSARNEFIEFITKSNSKIIKDWNGNIWLVSITENPEYSFVNEWGMGLGSLHFNWTEIGDAMNDDDLKRAGAIVWEGGGVQ